MVARRVGQVKAELTVVLIVRYSAWSGCPAAASLATPPLGSSRSIDCDLPVALPGDTPTRQWRTGR